jgi:hypothetical protein
LLDSGKGCGSAGMRDNDKDKDRGNESSVFIEAAD